MRVILAIFGVVGLIVSLLLTLSVYLTFDKSESGLNVLLYASVIVTGVTSSMVALFDVAKGLK